MAVADPQSRPRDGDRKRAVEEIDSAYAEGRITAADRSLRVANVEGASTLGELDMVVRDLKLDPGEVAPRMVPPPPAQPAPPPPPPAQPAQSTLSPQPTLSNLPPPPADPGRGFRVTSEDAAAVGTSVAKGFRIGCLLIVGIIVLISAGASFFIASIDIGGSSGSNSASEDPFPFPENTLFPTDATNPASPAAPVDKLALTVSGLRWFVGRYEAEFGTTRTLGVTIWADRASVDRSVQGGRRLERWSYDDGEFQKFGAVTTNARGTKVVDLRRLGLKALVANIARAKRTLNVEKPETIYVIIEDSSLGDGPEAHIYVSNKFNESGYLATTFGGRVVRSYPFQR